MRSPDSRHRSSQVGKSACVLPLLNSPFAFEHTRVEVSSVRAHNENAGPEKHVKKQRHALESGVEYRVFKKSTVRDETYLMHRVGRTPPIDQSGSVCHDCSRRHKVARAK
jgi:hypothetical protein